MTGPLGFIIGYIKLTVLVYFFFSAIFLGGISLLMPLDLMLAYFSAFGTISLFLYLSFEVSIRFDFSWDIVEWLADGN